MNLVITTETYLPFVAGVSTSTDNIARFMAKRGHSVTVIAPKPFDKDTVLREPNLRILRIFALKDFFFGKKEFTPFPFPIPTLLRELRKDRVDLVHIQEPGSIGLCALIIAKSRGIPVFAALHTDTEQVMRILGVRYLKYVFVWFFELYERLFYNAVSMIMVPTETFRKNFLRIGITRPIEPVSNGVDTTKYRPLEKKQPTKRDSKVIRFLYLGRVDTDKHIDVIIRALKQTDPNIQLSIVGKGNAERALHALVEETGLSSRITWHGILKGSAVLEAYQTADCFVIMSPYETQSIVTLEALACGLPVLACNAGALPELCHDGVNGFTINEGDDKTLAEKMTLLAKDAQLRSVMGKESRAMSLPHNRSTAFERLEALYQKIISAHSVWKKV